MLFKEKIERKKFVYTCEISLPSGSDLNSTFKKAELLRNAVDAINVIDCARAVMKISSIAVCRLLAEKEIETVCQIACRDKNVIGLQSDLLGANALGIKNILALTGDSTAFGDYPEAKKVFEIESTKLISLIHGLNSGNDLNGNKLNVKTDFFIGATFNPSIPSFERTKKKIELGAKFFQTQLVFEPEKFIEETKKLKQFDVAVLPSIMPLFSLKVAKFVNSRLPGVKVPEKIIKELESSSNQKKTGLEIAKRIIDEVKPFSQGIHFIPLWHEELVLELI